MYDNDTLVCCRQLLTLWVLPSAVVGHNDGVPIARSGDRGEAITGHDGLLLSPGPAVAVLLSPTATALLLSLLSKVGLKGSSPAVVCCRFR